MTDFLRIRRDGHEDLMLGYQGPWPPPLHLLVTEMDGKPLVVGATESEGTLHRVIASELPDDLDHPNVARGALYVEDPDTWDGRT